MGLFTARRKSPKAMLMNGATFGGFNYAITLLGMNEKKGEEEGGALTKEKGAAGKKSKVAQKGK